MIHSIACSSLTKPYFSGIQPISKFYRPTYVYHLTTQENWNAIQKEAKLRVNQQPVDPVAGIFTIDEKNISQGWSSDSYPLPGGQGKASGLSAIVLMLRDRQEFDPMQKLVLLKIMVDPQDRLTVRDNAHPMKIGEAKTDEEYHQKLQHLGKVFVEYDWKHPTVSHMEYPEYIIKHDVPLSRISLVREIDTRQLSEENIIQNPAMVKRLVLET